MSVLKSNSNCRPNSFASVCRCHCHCYPRNELTSICSGATSGSSSISSKQLRSGCGAASSLKQKLGTNFLLRSHWWMNEWLTEPGTIIFIEYNATATRNGSTYFRQFCFFAAVRSTLKVMESFRANLFQFHHFIVFSAVRLCHQSGDIFCRCVNIHAQRAHKVIKWPQARAHFQSSSLRW